MVPMRGHFQRACISLLVVLILSFAGAPSTGVLVPDEEGPECGVEVLPCEIGPGTHEGALQPFSNERDYYTFSPPEDPAAIQVEVHSDSELEAVIRDPQGRARGVDDGWPRGPIQVGAVAQPAGTWALEIGYRHFIGGGGSTGKSSYTFSLNWIHFDHVEQYGLKSGDAPTVTFLLDEEAYVEVLHEPDTDTEDPTAFRSLVRVRTPDYGFGHGYTYTSSSFPTYDPLKTWGDPPGDLHIGLSAAVGRPDSYAMDVHHPDPGPATVDMAYSTSKGIETSTAWVAYNEASPVLQERDGHAFYHRATDMEGGAGFFAAGLINAQDLWIEEYIPSSWTHSTSISVDAHNPMFADEPTIASVTDPDGETYRVVDDYLNFHVYESGTWRFDLEHIDGVEGKDLRFYGWSFPLSDW